MTRTDRLAAILLAIMLCAGCAAGERRAEATPYAPDPAGPAAPWADFDASDVGPGLPPQPGADAVAVASVREAKLVDPGAADLDALREGDSGPLGGEPLALSRALCGPAPVQTVRSLRGIAATARARRLLIARYTGGAGRTPRLEATLYDVASGSVLARYGPGEPSLSLAAGELGRRAPP